MYARDSMSPHPHPHAHPHTHTHTHSSLPRRRPPIPPQRPPPPPPQQQHQRALVLPEWQPDSECRECPICHAGFTFWNRRHHCRKCGRVVCHACSPHRITIPKAFVVHPPPHHPPPSAAPQVRICDDCLGRRLPAPPLPLPPPPPPPPPPPHYHYNQYYNHPPHHHPPQQQHIYSASAPPANYPRLRETDYCPICTHPLPAGTDELRERHVASCIRSVEDRTPSGSSNSVGAGAAASPVGRGRRYTGGARMVVWRAGEKDTWAASEVEVGSPREREAEEGVEEEEGVEDMVGLAGMVGWRAEGGGAERGEKRREREREKAECVICFEEFEVGDVIARLECLCRYHKKCIREWFDRKGNGECPVHAVHD